VLRALEGGMARSMKEDDLLVYMKKYEEKYMPLHGNEASSGR
jgi:hypothetical protein